MSSAPVVQLAADIGGTFTDIVLERANLRYTAKVLTTSAAPEKGVIEGTALVLNKAGLKFSDITLFVHGTTLATNALIERKGARTALITTEGFRDIIEIADESRYDQYDIYIEKPQPLVARAWRFTVPERMDVHGQVRRALDERAVEMVAHRLVEHNIEALAVVLLHSYANDRHERRVGEILASLCPDISVTLSSEVCPEVREYERSSTTIANAYVQPLMAGYLGRLQAGFAQSGYPASIHLMTSAGSLTSLETARRFPVRLIESGPAGGAILAAHVAAERGEKQVLSFDMGGTTAKICLIHDFITQKARTFEVDRAARFLKGSGLPLRIPVVEMIEIGAGGGSIARIDTLQRITVGPDSTSSLPGPACYGRGGTQPTVTDADLTLGKIDPAAFAGGTIMLDPHAAHHALAHVIGTPLSLHSALAAYGVTEIVDENMANAARVHSVERGAVAGDHVLIAFGGAAPLHAARLAEKLGIRKIIIPKDAGVGSAIGFLRAPAAYELVQSRFMRLDMFDWAVANVLLSAMSQEAHQHATQAAQGRALFERRCAYMRYCGQGHEIAVELPLGNLGADEKDGLRHAFETQYRALFARHIPGAAIEILSWSVTAATLISQPQRLSLATSQNQPASACGERQIYDPSLDRPVSVPVYQRADLQPGHFLSGPAVIVEEGTSTLVTASFDAMCDAGGALVLTRKETQS